MMGVVVLEGLLLLLLLLLRLLLFTCLNSFRSEGMIDIIPSSAATNWAYRRPTCTPCSYYFSIILIKQLLIQVRRLHL